MISGNVTITPGETTDAGTIGAHPYVPVVTAPSDGADIVLGEFAFDWTPVGNAHEHRIMVSDNVAFETPFIDKTITAPPFYPSEPIDLIHLLLEGICPGYLYKPGDWIGSMAVHHK